MRHYQLPYLRSPSKSEVGLTSTPLTRDNHQEPAAFQALRGMTLRKVVVAYPG
jgi:hypothetical protein